MINRRGLILGLTSLIASPALVRAESIMPVKLFKPTVTPAIYDPLLEKWIPYTVQAVMRTMMSYGKVIVRMPTNENPHGQKIIAYENKGLSLGVYS